MMKLKDALNMSHDEFAKLEEKYKETDSKTYENGQTHNTGESFGSFLEKGCDLIDNDLVIRGRLI